MKTLVDVLHAMKDVKETPLGVFCVIDRDTEIFFSYGELRNESLACLFQLRNKGLVKGDELVFQLSNNKDFIVVFWACILGGIIPVPITVSNANSHHQTKVFKVWEVLSNPFLITGDDELRRLKKGSGEKVASIQEKVIKLEELKGSEKVGLDDLPVITVDDLAFIQFSSGSTGTPKGVMIKHKNVMSNLASLVERRGVMPSDKILSWLPLTHDMGLVFAHLSGLFAQIPQIHIPPSLFAKDPSVWLDKIREHNATITSAPNFGFHHVLKHKRASEHWDLSSVRLIKNAGEPVSTQLCERFTKELFGEDRQVVYPCYGLAESTVGVTIPLLNKPLLAFKVKRSSLAIGQKVVRLGTDQEGVVVPSVGTPLKNIQLRISDEGDRELSEGFYGHIQLKGDAVTEGYYQNIAKTQEAFTEDLWLKTGDLGFVLQGELFVVGRAKEVIFVNGQNYYAHDIEGVLALLPDLASYHLAAVGATNAQTGTEDVLIFITYRKIIGEEFEKITKVIKEYLSKYLDLAVTYVIPVKNIPKTTSGKVQRVALKDAYLKGTFNAILDLQKCAKPVAHRKEGASPLDQVLLIFQQSLEVAYLKPDENIFEKGADSVKIVHAIVSVEERFGISVDMDSFLECPTAQGLVTEYL